MNKKKRKELLRKEREEYYNTYFYIKAKCRNCNVIFDAGKTMAYGTDYWGNKITAKKIVRDLKGLTIHDECGGVADIIKLEKRFDYE